MIYVGLDDTDILDYPGTNQLARKIAREIVADFRCRLIVRHQLLVDPRVPCTNKNGCAAMLLEPVRGGALDELIPLLRRQILDWAPDGSDPGLCVATHIPGQVVAWGQRCQSELVTQEEARQIAAELGMYLEGLGGTEGGVIGALAAVGLVSTGDDGRVVYVGQIDDVELFDIGGCQSADTIFQHGVDEIRSIDDATVVTNGDIDLGKRLRPNYRGGRVLLFVTRNGARTGEDAPEWLAVRVP